MAEPLRRVGRYDLLEVVGRGGAGVVYRAYQPDLDRQVALKELAPHHAADPSFAQRFVEESRLAASLNNPSIVTVFEYFEHDGLPYIAMEYMPRGSLRGYLRDLTGAQLGGLLESVLEGLVYGEQMGIVHRDLKPENLLVGGNGRVKIADFGVARALSSATPRPFATVTGTPIGTPAYMAPEQALGRQLTPATDLYSLGIVAWEALAGRVPFGSSDTPMAVLYQQVNEPVPPIDMIRDDVHPGAARWLTRMLAKAPEDRYGSAAESWDELEDVLIDMMGPRWRRDAALGGSAGSPDEQPSLSTDVRSAMPTAFSLQPGVSIDSATERRLDSRDPSPVSAVLTPDPLSSTGPELDPFVTTFTPEGTPPADDLHGFRAGSTGPRRHHERSAAAGRNRVTAAVLVAVLAAVAGVLIGVVSSPGPEPARAPITTTSALVKLAVAVKPVVASLTTESASGLKHFNAAHTLKTQKTAALALSARYSATDTKLKALGAGFQSLPELIALRRDVSVLASQWRYVAADAAHNRRTQYLATVKTIHAVEGRLATDAANATRG